MDHKQWLDNEYNMWVKALQESTIHDFKEHPMIKRMLGEIDSDIYDISALPLALYLALWRIDTIGRSEITEISGTCKRMIYYAQQILKDNPHSICEIGGGVGQFYAILRALGYKGLYFIYDLQEVVIFQHKYLEEVSKQTGLYLKQTSGDFDYCVSFYALGEFDDDTKNWYVENVVKKCPHGFIVYNPHSGASADINFDCIIEDEKPLLSPGNKQLTW